MECSETIEVDKKIDLTDVEHDAVKIWPSTPAIVWTLKRPQEAGIHVHAYQNGKKVLDDTFGQVRYEGQWLDRNTLLRNILTKANNTDWFLG